MMLSTEVILTFLSASTLLGLAPGPDNIFVMTQSTVHGKLAGIIVTLGLCTGLIIHSTAVALGASVIFQTSAVAFFTLKLIGVGYLIYLAWKSFSKSNEKLPTTPIGMANKWQLYCRGVIMNIANPKVSIFFMAFLPQFTDPSQGSITIQLLFLGGLFIVSTILIFGLITLLAGTFGQWLGSSDKVQKIMNKIAGMVFLCLAVKLILTKR